MNQSTKIERFEKKILRKPFDIRYGGGIMYQNLFTERFIVIAEKPSDARTIEQVLLSRTEWRSFKRNYSKNFRKIIDPYVAS